MSLVKWFRKNNKKVMAVVVVIIMLGFVAGPIIRRLGRSRTGQNQTVAYLADNKEITRNDLASARRELEVLKMLGADEMLRSIGMPLSRIPDLQAVLLSELLFSERSTSAILIKRIKQMIRMNKYKISDKQINDIYRRSTGSDLYWYCLENEAQLAGVRISNEQAGNRLASIIPQLTGGATYSQLIGALINQRGIPEKEILATFGKLMAVLEYAGIMCSSEDITTQQIMQIFSWENETIDVEFVKFDSGGFAATQGRPSEEKISAHFDKYKKFFAGAVSEENPYGFGYKLSDRVKLEYIAVRLYDIAETVTVPTQEETEEYYQKYIKQFTVQVPSEANDPNSPQIEQVQSYAEVAGIISKNLLQDRINSKAERILQEAKTLTEADLQETDIEGQNLSVEQLSLTAGDYETTAEQLSRKNKIKVYSGQTGLLSAADIQADEYLGRLYLKGYGYNNPVGLTQIIFAVDKLAASQLSPFDMPTPRMYENIGPVRDASERIMAIVRVTQTKKACEPESVNQTFSKAALRFGRDEEPAIQDVYSVKENVVEDLKKLAAMNTTKKTAEEFIKQVVKDGWVGALAKFNELYGQQGKQDESEPNVFELQSWTELQRISREIIGTLAKQSAGNPVEQLSVDMVIKEGQFISQLYSLVPQDTNSLDTVPLIMEFKPDMSYYVIKNIMVKRLEQKQYEKFKALQAYREDIIQSQSMAAVHFNPENILKRMNFRWAQED